jgi:hypothetical protein
MDEGRELWEKYCGFFDKSFSEQVAYSERQKQELFEKWKHTKAAKHLCPGGVERFEDIPLTTYDDYPILREFGKEVEALSERVPRGKDESLWDYYDRISKQVAPMLDGWLADEYGFCSKTSGTTGESKWFAHGRQFLERGLRNIIAFFVVTCSGAWGSTKLKRGDRMFGVGGSSPYLSGLIYKSALDHGFILVPPLEIYDNVTNMRKKIMIALKSIERGENIDFAGGIASAFHMTCRYFTDRTSLYKDYYQSMNFGIPKIILFFVWLYQKLFGKTYKKAMEIMPVKGMGAGGFDTEIYADFLNEQFGVEPLNIYGTTEAGFCMIGYPDRKRDLMPLLDSCYFEFLADNGKVKRIDGLERDEIYGLICTPFRSVLVRYKMEDLFKVVDFRNDGMPILRFESRRADLLDIRAYFRLSEALAVKALVEAGLPPTDKWAFVKETEPEEHLCLLMEREWGYSEKEASQRVFEALQKVDPFFQNYVRDFGIRDPWEVIKVEYLKKGAFMRYTMLRAKQGAEMGQIKPLKLITPKNRELPDLLRRI